LNKLSKDVNSILVEQYSNKISENQKLENMINEITDKYEKKYDKYYEDLSSQWNKYFHKKTNIKKNENKENILSSFISKIL
jgi:aromatic ring hydroxylase